MKEININNFEEKLYYEKLNNGFEIYLVPLKNKSNYRISMGIKYGNSYTNYKVNNKNYKTPSGVAHFLEHKLFERENNIDPFDYYSKSGTTVNACTSISYTSYYCIGNNNFNNNLDYMLKWITKIYINDKNVEKERGIILEEARMYKDNPDRVLSEKIRYNTFVNDPYGQTVVGSEVDINNITKEDLINSYNAFYKPDNMFLIITGNFSKDKALKIIKDNMNKIAKNTKKIEKEKVIEVDKVRKSYEEVILNVPTPRISINYKINKDVFKTEDYYLYMYLVIILRILFSDTSKFYEKGLESKLFIDFTYYLAITSTHVVITFDVITNKTNINEIIEHELQNKKIQEKDFQRIIKSLIANEIKTIDNINSISHDIFDDIIYYGDYKNNKIEDLKSLTFTKMKLIKEKINTKNIAIVKIINKNIKNLE